MKMKTDKPINLTLGSMRIKYLRNRYNLSQKVFSKIVKTSIPSISGIEQGQHVPGPGIINNIVCSFGVSADWLLGLGDAETNPGVEGKTGSLTYAESLILKNPGKGTEILKGCPGYMSNTSREALYTIEERRDILSYASITNFVAGTKEEKIFARISPLEQLKNLLKKA